MDKVVLVKTPDYGEQTLYESVCRQFELLDFDVAQMAGKRVLLKPNLLMKRRPEEATTTHPGVVRAVIQRLNELGVKDIMVADSPGGLYNIGALTGIYQTSGMMGAVEGVNAKLNYDVTNGTRRVKNYRRVSSFPIITPVLQADFIISITKLKTHGMTMLSGGVKNLFGCVPGLMKPEFHCRFPKKEDFCEMLVDLCECVHPDITIVDAVVSMEGNGPSGGTPRQTNLLFGACNPYALDCVLARFIGFEEEEIETIRASKARGLCGGFDAVALAGDVQEFVPVKDFQHPQSRATDFSSNVPRLLRKPVAFLVGTVAKPRPVIRKGNCVGCGKCAESCPQHIIQIRQGKAHIQYDECIRCFCCHEMCPVKAIDIRRFRLFDL